MKKLILLAAMSGLGVIANAVTFTNTVSVNGLQTFDGIGDLSNTVLNINLDTLVGSDNSNYVLTGIGWDVTIATIGGAGGSWRSEAAFNFTASDLSDSITLRPGYASTSPGTTTYTNPILNLAGIDPTFPVIMSSSDVLRLELFETFDDFANAADADINGSFTLQFEAQPVPEPATMTALGAGVLAIMRRKRNRA
jgi:hypothetical protein